MRRAQQLGTGLLFAVLGLVSDSEAQAPPLSNACQTAFGVCPAPLAPVGAPCLCVGKDPGRMIFMPFNSPPPVQQQTFSTSCATAFGVCQTSPAPVGGPCTCFGPGGRPDAGRVIR
jgi:hypothetical protein